LPHNQAHVSREPSHLLHRSNSATGRLTHSRSLSGVAPYTHKYQWEQQGHSTDAICGKNISFVSPTCAANLAKGPVRNDHFSETPALDLSKYEHIGRGERSSVFQGYGNHPIDSSRGSSPKLFPCPPAMHEINKRKSWSAEAGDLILPHSINSSSSIALAATRLWNASASRRAIVTVAAHKPNEPGGTSHTKKEIRQDRPQENVTASSRVKFRAEKYPRSNNGHYSSKTIAFNHHLHSSKRPNHPLSEHPTSHLNLGEESDWPPPSVSSRSSSSSPIRHHAGKVTSASNSSIVSWAHVVCSPSKGSKSTTPCSSPVKGDPSPTVSNCTSLKDGVIVHPAWVQPQEVGKTDSEI
jgi:hypothetical protein